jgi:hypothetical protein
MSEHNDNPHDEQISRLYRLGSSGEPPSHLDRKILDEAQRAVSRWKRIRSWPSLATAAVLVLSFSLLLKVLEERPLDRSLLQEESIEIDAVAPVSQDMDGGADAVKEEGETVAPPQPKAEPSEEFETGSMRSREDIPVPAKTKRKEAAVEKLQAPVAAPPAVFSAPAPAPLTDGFIGGANQADQAAAEPAAKLERKMDTFDESDGCGVVLPSEEAPASSWQQLYRELLEQEQREQAECLRQIYEQRFGHKLELSQTPESSVE